MKFLIIHNRYSRPGGEEMVVQTQVALLRAAGHTVLLYERSYDELSESRYPKLQSLRLSLGNPQAVRDIRQIVRSEHPDVAIVHNLFPVVSPAILPVLHREGVPVMMTLHNFRLVCPIGLLFNKGEICRKCLGQGRELHCITNRCQGTLLGSVAFALRSGWARLSGLYRKNIDRYLALSEFQSRTLLQAKVVPSGRVTILPNCIDPSAMPEPILSKGDSDCPSAPYVAYAGRLSPEKGIDLIVQAARQLPHIPFRIAGSPAPGFQIDNLPGNITLVGNLDRQQLANHYAGAQMTLLASRCYEGFPLSVLESMYYCRPVIVPRMGGLPDIITECVNGAFFEPGSSESLREVIARLWENPHLCETLGVAARRKVEECYLSDRYRTDLERAAADLLQQEGH